MITFGGALFGIAVLVFTGWVYQTSGSGWSFFLLFTLGLLAGGRSFVFKK